MERDAVDLDQDVVDAPRQSCASDRRAKKIRRTLRDEHEIAFWKRHGLADKDELVSQQRAGVHLVHARVLRVG